jgi:hypothetical protein
MKEKKKIFIFLVAILFCGVATIFSVKAQQTSPYTILLGWETNSFYPSNYQGKPLPSDGSLVRVSLQLLKDNKIIDASAVPIKWYVNNKYFNDGVGMTNISFVADEGRGSSYSIKASVKTNEDIINEFLTIPVVQKELIIETTAINGKIKPNSSVTFSAVPYFFNIQSLDDLTISWNIQNQKIPNEKKSTLFVQFGEPKTDSQREIQVGTSVEEKGSFFSTVENTVKIQIEK